MSMERKQRVVELCQKLVREKSCSGEESGVAERLREAFQELGFDEVFVDEFGNVTGLIRGRKAGKTILFDGHIDTVPVPDASKWLRNPFGGELMDGKIFGRGASDMKGALSAMVGAAGFFAEDCRKDFAGCIYVAGVVHEECFEGVAARRISHRIRPDYVVIGEASELDLKIGQRGRAEIVVETFGKPAHSANPKAGVNAVYKMAEIISRIRSLHVSEHPILGQGIMELTDIKSSPYPGASVVPDYCRVTYDRRLLVGESQDSVLQPIVELLQTMRGSGCRTGCTGQFCVRGGELLYGENNRRNKIFPGMAVSGG